MLSLRFSQVATVASPFCPSVFHFLTKPSEICEIFFSCEKKRMNLSLLHKNVNTSSHWKGTLMALTAVYQFELWLKVRDVPSKLSLPRQGPRNLVWVKQVFELSEVESAEFHCIHINGCNIYPVGEFLLHSKTCVMGQHVTCKTYVQFIKLWNSDYIMVILSRLSVQSLGWIQQKLFISQ